MSHIKCSNRELFPSRTYYQSHFSTSRVQLRALMLFCIGEMMTIFKNRLIVSDGRRCHEFHCRNPSKGPKCWQRRYHIGRTYRYFLLRSRKALFTELHFEVQSHSSWSPTSITASRMFKCLTFRRCSPKVRYFNN